MKMKKLITLLLALAMVLSLAACGSKDTPAPDGQNTPAATYKIKLGTTGNEEHQSTIAANFFKEKVEELTNGAVTVEIYPNSQLGSEREMAEGVKLGTLEMTIVTTDGTLPAWVPETQVLSIPYLLTSKEVAYEVLDNTLQPYFAPLFEAQGFKHLAFCELGFRHFTTNKREITCAADMKGQSIRVQEAPIWFALTDCLGATATPVAFNELYTALSQGMVDGQENPIPSIASSKFYEVQKYMCLDGHTYGAESILINLDYSSLPRFRPPLMRPPLTPASSSAPPSLPMRPLSSSRSRMPGSSSVRIPISPPSRKPPLSSICVPRFRPLSPPN